MTCAYTIATFINQFVTVADDVPGEQRLAQADVKNCKSLQCGIFLFYFFIIIFYAFLSRDDDKPRRVN